LASALLVFDASAPSGVSGISSARVDSLLGVPTRWRVPMRLMAVSVAALCAVALVLWQASGVASVRATFNVPFLSSQPCLVMVVLLPLLCCVAVARHWPRVGEIKLGRG
jgi:hypothetical protein